VIWPFGGGGDVEVVMAGDEVVEEEEEEELGRRETPLTGRIHLVLNTKS
jgi:hypothetical protein